MKRPILLLTLPLMAFALSANGATPSRHFIAHRGATMRCTLSGENSREAIALAARAGFDCIETDVRYTCDSVLVAMHDENLSRAYTYVDGRAIPKQIKISDVSYAFLRDSIRTKAIHAERRTAPLRLEEFCEECKARGLYLFIEPKKVTPDWVYPRMIATADRVFGRGKYVITSNNDANDHIRRDLHIEDIPLMGILYQSTYDHIASLQQVIMAVSTTRFDEESYQQHIAHCRQDGLPSESHADTFVQFDRINRIGVDYVSTDLLAPDYHGQGKTLYHAHRRDIEQQVARCNRIGEIDFGAIYLCIRWRGSATVTLGKEQFILPETSTTRQAQHQLMLFDHTPDFNITNPSDDFQVEDIEVRVVRF
jgi:glycerophosphoryl diester phosphodiesterase